MSYALVALIVVATVVLWRAISNVLSTNNSRFDSLDEKLEKLQQSADELEFRSLTPAEKEFRRYQHARNLTLAEIENVKEGETLHLISCSYNYPSSEPAVLTFDYRHGSLGKQSVVGGKTYVSVNGSWQLGGDGRWFPYTFEASAGGCATNSHDGEVRRLF